MNRDGNSKRDVGLLNDGFSNHQTCVFIITLDLLFFFFRKKGNLLLIFPVKAFEAQSVFFQDFYFARTHVFPDMVNPLYLSKNVSLSLSGIR